MSRVAIVTGGTRGIGKACVEKFRLEGWQAVATSSAQDVRDRAACKAVVTETLEKYGAIDCLVNNAGIVRNKPFMLMTSEEWQDVIDVDLTGPFNMTRAVVYPMARKGGTIVNISSVAGIMGMRGQVNYSAAKAGLFGFTRALARELAPMKVRVNALAVGLIETDMTRKEMELSKSEARVKCFIPMQKAGQPADVAEAVYFLASEQSAYITGSVLRVDGGLVAGDDG